VEEHNICIPVASRRSLLEAKPVLDDVVLSYKRWLGNRVDEFHGVISDAKEVDELDERMTGIAILVLCGGTVQLIKSIAEKGKPVLVLAHEGMNSLPAALEALPSISEDDPPQLLFGMEEAGLKKLEDFFKGLKALDSLRGQRILLVNGSDPGLPYSIADEGSLKERLGIEIVNTGMSEFRAKHDGIERSKAVGESRKMEERAPIDPKLDRDSLERSAKIYLTMKDLVDDSGVSASSLNCFPLLDSYDISGCYALSALNDEGIVSGCEGDVPSTVAMMVLKELSGQPAFMGNATYIDEHRVVIAHCTIATKLTTTFGYTTHFESGKGVGITGELRKGERVTILRFSRAFNIMRAGEGTITKGKAWSKELCRTQVEIEIDGDARSMMERPLGSHYALTYGRHLGSLEQMARLSGMHFEKM
jgi:L-fucose isomerase-like protein